MEYVRDVYPLKAQFRTNEPVEISLELVNPTEENKDVSIDIYVIRLVEIVENIRCKTRLTSGGNTNITVALTPKDVEFEGYGIDVSVFADGKLEQEISSSFDVVSDWRRATRYGFLSDFYTRDKGDEEDVKSLCKFHLNLVQFYDWMYRHNDLIPPTPEYMDLMGRKMDFDVVKEKIAFCHRYGMKAIAYGAIYAASIEFFNEHKEWGLYNSSGEVYNFIDIFKIMNISPDSPWHTHIIGQYRNAIDKAGFDGIHMDTYGFPKTGMSRIDMKEKTERLEEAFPVLINNTRKELERINRDVCLIFNNVGNWPVDTVAEAGQDALYIEVWDPYERYHHIQEILRWAKHLGKGKQVILAAYLKPFKEKDAGKTEKDAEQIEEAQVSALLLTSAIAANGGYHLLLGEKNGILTQGYYADYSRLQDDFIRTLRNYYDFIVRYSKILYDNELRDVSMTHFGGENLEYVFENAEFSPYGEPGRVWVIIREKPGRKTISFVNLTGNSEDYWNKGKRCPIIQKDILVKVQIEKPPECVFLASPDSNFGRPAVLEFEIEDSDRGKVMNVRIPELHVWNLLVIEF